MYSKTNDILNTQLVVAHAPKLVTVNLFKNFTFLVIDCNIHQLSN